MDDLMRDTEELNELNELTLRIFGKILKKPDTLRYNLLEATEE